jgi:lipopolysaccharide/colanic/teichoic acid biosynthesis glycosyltransferase
VVSATVLVALAPLLAVVAALIKLTSPGPVFFLQHRLGLNKRRFSIYKFRTMVPDAELRLREIEHLNEVSGPVFKIKDDPRITPMGRFLRKTSIDELPQLFNVLKGDMSLVGPRPLPIRDCDGFDKDWQRRRFSVRPGITCLWQINGRNSIPFEKWMQLDLEYIDMWSLRLDFEILLRTIPAVLKGSGAA